MQDNIYEIMEDTKGGWNVKTSERTRSFVTREEAILLAVQCHQDGHLKELRVCDLETVRCDLNKEVFSNI